MALLLPPASTSAPPLEVQYFAANVLRTKATRDWAEISQEPGQSTALMENLLRFLQHQQPKLHREHEHRLVLFRVCHTLTTLAVKSTPRSSFSGITLLVNEAFNFLGGNADVIPSSPATSLTIGLCLIRALPEEVGRVDMSRGRRKELQQETLRQDALNLEEEDFVGYREGDALKTVLESCYAILRVQFSSSSGKVHSSSSSSSSKRRMGIHQQPQPHIFFLIFFSIIFPFPA
ncbi:hypothetical protein VYU27_006571 [Nannochloropsis oceanica]